MTCTEFERVLPEIVEESQTSEQRSHLTGCPYCATLVSDLKIISQQARFLQESDDPSPRVWNGVELALRQEGLIHDPKVEALPGPLEHRSRWRMAWLVPAMAALLIGIGFFQHQKNSDNAAVVSPSKTPAPDAYNARLDTPEIRETNEDDSQFKDQEFLREVALRSPSMRDSYGADLENANAYIRDARIAARSNPTDEEAQRYVINAYEQKAMIYEMALDRPLQ